MKKIVLLCDKCSAKIACKCKICPLCGEVVKLDDINKENFPKLDKAFPIRKFKRAPQELAFFKVYLAISITLVIASIILNLILTPSINWSFLVFACAIYIFFLVKGTILDTKYFSEKVVTQAIILSWVVIGLQFLLSTNLWAFEFVLPFIYTISMIMIGIYLIISIKKDKPFLLNLIEIGFLGIVPWIVVNFNDVKVVWPSIVTASLSISAILTTVICAPKKLLRNLKKIFNI